MRLSRFDTETMNKIFVNSTYQDLVDHRKAVTDVLSRMKLHFTAMEFFGSRTDEAVNVCNAEIEECLRDRLIQDSQEQCKLEILAGEIMRRNPSLLGSGR